jgi:hypothetical protein
LETRDSVERTKQWIVNYLRYLGRPVSPAELQTSGVSAGYCGATVRAAAVFLWSGGEIYPNSSLDWVVGLDPSLRPYNPGFTSRYGVSNPVPYGAAIEGILC